MFPGYIPVLYIILATLITLAPIIIIIQLGMIASRLREIIRRMPPRRNP